MEKSNSETKQIVIDDLIKFKEVVDKFPEGSDILNDIFELTFKHSKEDTLFNDLFDQVQEIFKYNPQLFFDYLSFLPLIEREELFMFNRLRYRYGIFLRRALNVKKNPFLITNVEINIEGKSNLHKIKFSRNDDEYLEGQFDPESLLKILTLLNQGLTESLKIGLYNLSYEEIKKHLGTNNDLAETLSNLLRENN